MDKISQPFLIFIQQSLPPGISHASITLGLFISVLTLVIVVFVFLFLNSQASKKLKHKEAELNRARRNAENNIEKIKDLEIKSARLETLQQSEREHAAEKLQLLEQAREEMRLQFGSLAQQIFDEKSVRFSELNREKLTNVIQPFKDQLGNLKKEINDIYRTDSRERISLKTEISHLKKLNQQINQEAANLTNALKTNTKIQGSWGELVLERILEKSGLRKGIEYESQASFRDQHNRLYKPDIVVHLPAGKDIIVDSKVSLISWEKYVSSEEETERNKYMQELCRAIRDHIISLSSKNYSQLSGLYSLNFVLMFMPIEAAFSGACQFDKKLIDEALSNNIILVTPTTLLAALRTVENIWQNEQRSKNSLEIARRAGLMLDKFGGFVEEIEKIGNQLGVCQKSYDAALGKLCKGRGNLIRQAEQLKKLGVQAKKELPKTITEQTDYLEDELLD